MYKLVSGILTVLVLVSLLGCASTPASAPPGRNNRAASDAALAAMDGGGANSASRGEPAWVAAPYSVYNEREYLAASGHGSDRALAEKNALAALTAIFGQTIQADIKVMETYSEAVKNGAVDVSGSTALQEAIQTSTQLDALVGAEIKDVWYDGRSVYYAAAVMERVKAAGLYADMISSNQRIIQNLVTIPNAEKNTMDGYSRYRLAAAIADANQVYVNVLSVVGKGTGAVSPGELKKGDDYRLEAVQIAQNIPIGIRVRNDRSDRIRSAFAAAISKAGFRSGGNNSRYMLNVTVALSEVQLASQQNKFARYEVDANLIDTANESVLLPFSVNGREGHLSLPEAENRAVSAAEKKINDNYEKVLSEYLSTLLPK